MAHSSSRARLRSLLTIEKRPAAGDELEQDILVADIRRQDDQAELLRLQKQHTVLQRTQPAVPSISLQAA